jgi:hypothetical protein
MQYQISLASIVAITLFAIAGTTQAEEPRAESSLFTELTRTVQEVLSEKVAVILVDTIAATVDSSRHTGVVLNTKLVAAFSE